MFHCTRDRNDAPHQRELDDLVLIDAKDAVTDCDPITLSYKVKNTHRNIGTKVSGEIGYQYGRDGLPEGTIHLKLKGSAGQSFGTFLSSGIRLDLTGEANDYVGKGMSGGEIIVRPVTPTRFAPHENSLIGNTVMYGATGGTLFASGRAGERFCVRNSGGTAVVEGVGDHGCEYMTNGLAVILGRTGRNFGAGMTGGAAYVLDLEGDFESLINPELISIGPVADQTDIDLLRGLIVAHFEKTGSDRARDILGSWEEHLVKFVKVRPKGSAAASQIKSEVTEPAVKA